MSKTETAPLPAPLIDDPAILPDKPLATRLRKLAAESYFWPERIDEACELMTLAADAIEARDEELARLRGGLEENRC